jgi:hypothetical protein
MENEVKNSNHGAVIGAVIIIILLIAAGWYFIGNRVEKIQEAKTIEVTTGDSTEVADLQTDLDNLDPDTF